MFRKIHIRSFGSAVVFFCVASLPLYASDIGIEDKTGEWEEKIPPLNIPLPVNRALSGEDPMSVFPKHSRDPLDQDDWVSPFHDLDNLAQKNRKNGKN